MGQFRAPMQVPLPEATGGDPSDQTPEGVKYETTAKGPRWRITIHRENCNSDAEMVNRIADIDRRMRDQFGQPT